MAGGIWYSSVLSLPPDCVICIVIMAGGIWYSSVLSLLPEYVMSLVDCLQFFTYYKAIILTRLAKFTVKCLSLKIDV